jgi:protein-S-isoprenylcysteine O-methyltransferase Ste14
MTTYRWLIIACWIGFIVYWAISAAAARKTVGGVWRGMAVRAVIALAAVVLLRGRVGGALRTSPIDAATSTRAGIGVAVCVIGLAFAIWARVHLGRNWGMPRAVKENPELVTSGPYAYVRHPIYSGMLVAMIGSAMVFGLSWLLIAVISGAYFIYSAIEEEKLMRRTFPDSYPAYQQRTKMLIPFVL